MKQELRETQHIDICKVCMKNRNRMIFYNAQIFESNPLWDIVMAKAESLGIEMELFNTNPYFFRFPCWAMMILPYFSQLKPKCTYYLEHKLIDDKDL